MEDIIKQIIEDARRSKASGMDDLSIAKYVHQELGKYIVYNNSYSNKLNDEGIDTEVSRVRKEGLLAEETNINSNSQICKGMAEIYAVILNLIGIEAHAIGVHEKGELTAVPSNEAKHYCTVFTIDGNKYVQDYMIEKALSRIKAGENFKENIPGLCSEADYPLRAKANLGNLHEDVGFYQRLVDNSQGDDNTFRNMFNKLNEYMNSKNIVFGFEEAKDFILLMGKNNVKDLREIQFVNLIKESEINCDLQTIYMLNGKQYLVSNDHGIEIDNNIINNMIEDGYVGRNNQDRSYINGLNGITRK